MQGKKKEKCYHWDVGDKESINKFQEMLDSEITKYLDNIGATLDEIMKATKIRYKPNAVDKHSDVYNIEFVPSGTGDDDIDALFLFSSLVTDELKLCNMPFSGTLEEHREALKQQLVLEEKLILIKQAIDRSEIGKAAALLLIKQAIPCIMHSENRVGEKILAMLLSIGANLYQQRRAASNINDFIAQVESIASTVILGTEWRPKQWRVPTKENSQEIASVSLTNS